MENNVKLTILCVVYNHKDYIRRTIESFLNQKLNTNMKYLFTMMLQQMGL